MLLPKEKQKSLDSLCRFRRKSNITLDFPLAQFVLRNKRKSCLYSSRGISHNVFTANSKKYFDQSELIKIRRGQSLTYVSGVMDSVTYRYNHRSKDFYKYTYAHRSQLEIYEEIRERYFSLKNYLGDLITFSVRGVSTARMWNLSIVSALIFGMFLMTMVYRYLGQGAAAKSRNLESSLQKQELVLGEEDVSWEEKKQMEEEADDLTLELLKSYNEEEAKAEAQKRADEEEREEKKEYEEKIRKMVKGYPIESMVSEIAKKDKAVAAFLVGIAKKESNWGKRVPVLNGEDCYNYWGYRGKRAKMGTGGHTCFDSPKDAVDTVSRRIEFLVKNEKLNNPNKMVVVWKCGYDCSWDDPQNVRKWVSDVDTYFKKLDFVREKND